MKKHFILLLLLATFSGQSQTNYTPVLELLFNNKREEARKLFDKQFDKLKTSNVDLLFIDAFIDSESGKIDFDDTFVRNLENIPNSEMYIAPFINSTFVLSDIKEGYYNELAYKKIDFLAASPKFQNLPIVKYRKAVLDSRRYNVDSAKQRYAEMDVIRKWQFCGVFENLNSSGLHIDYEPENYPKSDKLFDANSNGKVGWYIPKATRIEPYTFFQNEADYGSGIIYAQTFIESKESKSYRLNFGSKLGMKIFLNDKEIYVNEEIYNSNLDAYAIKIDLNKGFNRLLFKIESGSGVYFSAQIRTLENKNAIDLNYFDAYQEYAINKSDSKEPQEYKLEYEQYFDDLVTKNPTNDLYKIFRFNAYEANYKSEKALEALDGLDIKYPNSSFISNHYIRYYNLLEGEAQKIKELSKKVETNDPEHYFNALRKFTDKEWLTEASIVELEQYRDKTKKYKQKYCEVMFDFMIATKKLDVDEMISQYHKLVEISYNNEKLTTLESTMYESLKSDKTKSLAMLEKMFKEKDIYQLANSLIDKYKDQNQKDKALKIIEDRVAKFPYLNSFRTELIDICISKSEYQKALDLVDINIANFPYSFTDFEKKASIYSLMKNGKEAEKYLRKALSHNASNTQLRKQLYDITKTPSEIDEIEIKDIYKLVKERRNKKVVSDKGIVMLLDQYIVNVFPEGGRKSKVVYLYEITSENGIEEIKEYSLSSSYNNIIKSEIINSDGTIVPAERSDETLVFSNLKVGDVVYIEYERYDNASGRFYNDFNVTNNFNGFYPSNEAIFAFIYPENFQYSTVFANGEIPFITKKINNKIAKIWKKTNLPSIPIYESYAPNYTDIYNKAEIGTIKSWKEIANWYADLVKKNLKIDKITTATFQEIFPNGFAQLSQEQIVKNIYSYIEKNITYSSLDFRQSGYVPQKPAKTITTKLGDCKDVSTLFVALSSLAGIKSNLVLVLTNDNGFKNMLLPSIEFNHCIVKVEIDKKDIYLELTDKYLPFNTLPNSLYHANALIISFDKVENENSKLIFIPIDNFLININKSKTIVNITDKTKEFVVNQSINGANKSYFNELFSAITTDEIRKNKLEEDYNAILKKVVVLKSSRMQPNDVFDSAIVYDTEFSVSEKLQSVGSIKILEIPFIEKAYTRDIISTETRNFDINYFNYENFNEYTSEIILNVENGKKFTEVPADRSLKFDGHLYEIKFELIASNSLKIVRNVKTSRENILTSRYKDFKKYVEEIIEIEDQVLGFK